MRMEVIYGKVSPLMHIQMLLLSRVFLVAVCSVGTVWQSADEDTETSLSVTARPPGCAYIYCIFLYNTGYSNE